MKPSAYLDTTIPIIGTPDELLERKGAEKRSGCWRSTIRRQPSKPDRWQPRRGRASVSAIDRIRQKVRERNYYLSSHAEDEMVEDGFDRSDVEKAILHGFVERKMTRDPRGTRYRIEGAANDGRRMHVVCRFHEVRALIIITVYARG